MTKLTAKSFDWDKVKNIILEEEDYSRSKIDIESVRKILKDRALILARKSQPVMDNEIIKIIEFQLSNETYAFELKYVNEVYPLKEYTPVPCTPALIVGIVNVRGKVISVVDLRKFFSLPAQGITDFNKIIIIENSVMQFGVLADSIKDVCTVNINELQKELPTLKGINSEFLLGVTNNGVIILDTERILTDKRFVIKEDVI